MFQNPYSELKHYQKQATQNKSSQDNVYFEIDITNDGSVNNLDAVFEQSRNQNILDEMSDFYLAFLLFHIPAYDMPVFIPPIKLNQAVSVNITDLNISLEYDSEVQTQDIIYNSLNASQPPDASLLPFTQQPADKYYFTYEYQNLVDWVNLAFTTAFNALASTPSTMVDGNLVESVPPRMIYDDEINKFSIIVQQLFYDVETAGADLIKIYWNESFQVIFDGFAVNGVAISADQRYLLNAKDQLNNYYNVPHPDISTDDPLLQMRQQFVSIQNMNPIKNLSFDSNLLKVRGELNKVQNSFVKTIADFAPITNPENDVRSAYQFIVTGELRKLDILGNGALKKIDIKVYYTSIYNVRYLLSIPKYQYLTLKLLFIRKNLYKNYNPIYN